MFFYHLVLYLKKTQQGQDFNSLGILEVSRIALEELLQNAIIHRDYFKGTIAWAAFIFQ